MAEIRKLLFARHLRGEASTHILRYRKGRLVASGRGLSFWFLPFSTGIAVVPMDNRELHFVFHGRSSDFQDVTTQGVVTFRIGNAEKVAERTDFNLNLQTGVYLEQPLEQLSLVITQLAQQFAAEYMVATPIETVLAEGIAEIRQRVTEGLQADTGLADMGLVVVSVRISAIKPDPDLEKAIEAPVREHIQQRADEASFERRALAVQNERAIRENELQNQIELAKREAQLIEEQGKNARRQMEEESAAARIKAQGEAERQRLEAETRAETTKLDGAATGEKIRQVETARAEAEKGRMDAYRDVPPQVLWGLAAQELGKKLQRIEHLNLSPDLLGPLMANLLEAGTRHLDSDSKKK